MDGPRFVNILGGDERRRNKEGGHPTAWKQLTQPPEPCELLFCHDRNLACLVDLRTFLETLDSGSQASQEHSTMYAPDLNLLQERSGALQLPALEMLPDVSIFSAFLLFFSKDTS